MSDWELFTESEDTKKDYQKYLEDQSTGILSDDISFDDWLISDDGQDRFQEYVQDMADESYERNFGRGND